MPYIAEDVFNDQMRGLMVARGNYLSAKDKEEKKRYWFLEFRACDERAFIRTMEQLKYGEGSFPSYAEFKDQYNIIMPPSERLAGREYCGFCVKGTVLFRDLNSEGEVRDMAAGCSKCSPKRDSRVNPHNLHKDRVGILRTFEALKVDRICIVRKINANCEYRRASEPNWTPRNAVSLCQATLIIAGSVASMSSIPSPIWDL